MRQIVVGALTTLNGVQTVNVWFRFAVPAGRQAYYASQSKSYQPIAPGDYSGTDSGEPAAFQSGQWIERAGFVDVVDPTSPLATIQTRLINIYAAAASSVLAVDNAALARWDSSYDGSIWTMRSA